MASEKSWHCIWPVDLWNMSRLRLIERQDSTPGGELDHTMAVGESLGVRGKNVQKEKRGFGNGPRFFVPACLKLWGEPFFPVGRGGRSL